MAGPDDLRVSDEQRERAAQDIREHFAAGRLTDDELSERVQAAYSARTEQQLRAALADLPKLPATPAEQKAELAARRSRLRRRMFQEAGGGVGTFALCVVIWAVSGASGFFWPLIVLAACLLPLVSNGWRLYGPAPDFDHVERELDARRSKNELRNQGRGEVRGDRAARRSGRHGGRS